MPKKQKKYLKPFIFSKLAYSFIFFLFLLDIHNVKTILTLVIGNYSNLKITFNAQYDTYKYNCVQFMNIVGFLRRSGRKKTYQKSSH